MKLTLLSSLIKPYFYITKKSRKKKISQERKKLLTWKPPLGSDSPTLTDINPDFMKSFFTIKEIPYCLRNGSVLKKPSARSTWYRKNSILFRACLVSNKLPLSVKQSQSLIEFKSNIKTLRKIGCFFAKFAVYNFMVYSD